MTVWRRGRLGVADVPTDLRWRKSSTSSTGECVEVAFGVDQILVRHSRDPGGPVLRFTKREWEAFLSGVRAGEFEA